MYVYTERISVYSADTKLIIFYIQFPSFSHHHDQILNSATVFHTHSPQLETEVIGTICQILFFTVVVKYIATYLTDSAISWISCSSATTN